MSPELYLSIMAIIVSVASVVFIILELGMKMGVEFREEEVTSQRKQKIDDRLKAEFSQELTNITEMIVAKKESNEALRERILGLARMDYYSDFAKRMLDKMNTYNSQFLKGLVVSVFVIILTITFWIFAIQDYPSFNILLLLIQSCLCTA